MKYFSLLFLIPIVIAGCQPSAEDIEKAISQTQIASPTETPIPTPTPIPLQDIKLSEIMFVKGDLPAGFEPSQIRSEGIADAEIIETDSINMFHQDVVYQGEFGGKVSIYLYSTPEQALIAFKLLLSGLDSPNFETQEITNLGEQAIGQDIYVPLVSGLDPIEAAKVAFIRCNAVVVADFELASSYSGLIDYAKSLDTRLSNLVCR